MIARWWAEFNDDFRPHEVPYFQRFIERDGEPALDVACGTGRLLLPYLRAGLDVDGCDISADMIELCREKAAREGLSPKDAARMPTRAYAKGDSDFDPIREEPAFKELIGR